MKIKFRQINKLKLHRCSAWCREVISVWSRINANGDVFFRDLRPANLDKGQEACRLRLYQLYAWGVPLVIATLAAVLDRISPEQYVSLIRPKFGEHRCWFYGKSRLKFYQPNCTKFMGNVIECVVWKSQSCVVFFFMYFTR